MLVSVPLKLVFSVTGASGTGVCITGGSGTDVSTNW